MVVPSSPLLVPSSPELSIPELDVAAGSEAVELPEVSVPEVSVPEVSVPEVSVPPVPSSVPELDELVGPYSECVLVEPKPDKLELEVDGPWLENSLDEIIDS